MIQRTVATVLGGVVVLRTVALFQGRADHSSLALLEWAVLSVCLIGPLWLAWKPMSGAANRAELTWLTVLLYAGISVAFRLQ